METILVTGFGPFGQHEINITQQIAERLDGSAVDGFRVQGLVLPVQFERAVAALEEAFGDDPPVAIVSCGISTDPERTAMRVELAAVNDRTYRKPDIDGELVSGEAVEASGPPQVFSTLPVSAIKQAWTEQGLEGELSEDAGRYLCNAVFYWASRRLSPAGFIHVPADPAQLEDALAAVRLAVAATATKLAAQRVEATA